MIPQRFALLMGMTGWLCSGVPTTLKGLQSVAGRWVFAFEFNRQLGGCLYEVWKAISLFRSGHLAGKVVQEFLLCMCGASFLEINMRWKLDPWPLVSDASETGGGACYGGRLTLEGERAAGVLVQSRRSVELHGLLVIDLLGKLCPLLHAAKRAKLPIVGMVMCDPSKPLRDLASEKHRGCICWTHLEKISREQVAQLLIEFPRIVAVIAGGRLDSGIIPNTIQLRALARVMGWISEVFVGRVTLSIVGASRTTPWKTALLISRVLRQEPWRAECTAAGPERCGTLFWTSFTPQCSPGVWVVPGMEWNEMEFQFSTYLAKPREGNASISEIEHQEVLAGYPVGTTATRKQLEASGKEPKVERQLLQQRLALLREAFPLGVAAWLITAGLFESGLLRSLASPAEMQDQFAKTVWHQVQDETIQVQLCGPRAQLSSTESQPENGEMVKEVAGSEAAMVLAKALASRADVRGCDVRLDTGLPFRSQAWPRSSVDVERWAWHVVLSYPFKQQAHINELELFAFMMAVKWRLRTASHLKARYQWCSPLWQKQGAALGASTEYFED